MFGLIGPAFATVAFLEDDGQDYVGRLVVISNPDVSQATACGEQVFGYRAVIVNPGGGPAIITTIKIDSSLLVKVGDRFRIIFQEPCNPKDSILEIEPL